MNIVMPLAGLGSRFQCLAETHPEYRKPKPFILVKGIPMVQWATASLPPFETKKLIFIIRTEQEQEYSLSQELKKLYGPDITVIIIPTITQGAAETVLFAKKYINVNEPLIVCDSDHYVDSEAMKKGIAENQDIDGLIPVFRAIEPKWSFSHVGEDGYVDQVAEKNPISEFANIGIYYFRDGRDFVEGAEQMIHDNERVKNEFYIAPIYNKLIEKKKKIKLVFPSFVYGLGTPEDLNAFINNSSITKPL